jgi:two-component system CheB/CheR fusion protein
MKGQPTRVLLIEDDEDDYFLTRDLLADIPGNPFRLERVKDYDAGLEAIGQGGHDVYLLDYRLGRHSGLELLAEAGNRGCTAPIILLTGQGEREVDVSAMKAGAADYLTKGRMDSALLERSIRHALERHRDREALRQAKAELERRVQERTAALERALEALRGEFAERQQAEEALKEADRRKDEFLAMLAHELRNPLAPLLNGLHILRTGRVDGPTAERVRFMMEQQVRTLTRLVDDLLDVSRITRGKIQLRKERTDLATVVGRAVETVRPLIELQKHELSLSLPPEPVPLEADVTRLEQILTNLLNNAAKYTEPGGHIHLTAERDHAEVVLRVRDNGMGIPGQLLPHIFDMFTQADRSLDRAQGGLGIGLTLVRRLVELHGGRVLAHSDGPGRGSEFLVGLPALAPQPDGEPEPPRPPEPVKAEPRRVLVVEDEVAVAEMLVMLLELWGHQVQAVFDGPAALAAVQTFHPQVILCDIGLPGMSGYQLARQLRQQGAGSGDPHPAPAQPVLVAITGYGQEEDRHCAQRAGFDHHLTKPVDPPALEALLARCAAV